MASREKTNRNITDGQRMRIAVSLVAFTALSAPVLHAVETGGTTQGDSATAAQSTGSTSTDRSGTASMEGDAAFVQKAMESGKMEVIEAQAAMKKAQSTDVRDVAKMIHRDHTMSNGKLEQVVEDKPSLAPSKDGLRAMETPKQGAATADAADFDRAYIQEQIQAHKESIALFRKQSAEGSDPELRRFAEENLPVLERHLEALEQAGRKHGAARTSNTGT
jgi:putative membrane protein